MTQCVAGVLADGDPASAGKGSSGGELPSRPGAQGLTEKAGVGAGGKCHCIFREKTDEGYFTKKIETQCSMRSLPRGSWP